MWWHILVSEMESGKMFARIGVVCHANVSGLKAHFGGLS